MTMSLSHYLPSDNKKIFLLGGKLFIIILTSYYLLGNFLPFYEGVDAYLYGLGAIDMVNGSYEYSNEFLQSTDLDNIFATGAYVKTSHGTLIPDGSFGIFSLSALSYLLGGYYGLFYLGPISTILFLIISERIVTKLFGGFVGFIALIFLSTDVRVLNVGSNLLTDSIFSLLLILGSFFLIKFLKERNDHWIILCSSFLTAATFFRYNGAIFFPIEIILVSGYFLFQYIKTRKKDDEITDSSNIDLNLIKPFSKIKIKKIFKITLFLLGPWSIFFIFLLSFNMYFFDEPFTTYLEQKRGIETGNLISSTLIFDSERFESIKEYSAELVPDRTFQLIKMISFGSVLLNQYLYSIISFSFLFSVLFISLYFKINRTEIIVFIGFILGLLLFYSANQLVSLTGVTGRYMIPVLPFSFGILGYLMYRAWKIKFQKISIKNLQIFSKSWKGFLIIIFVLFFLTSIYYSKSVDSIFIKQNFEFKNPEEFASRYPLDKEGLTEKSIIVSRDSKKIRDYQAISFNPFSEYDYKTKLWSGEKPNEIPITMMHELLDKGYELYVFKILYPRDDPSYYKYLEEEHNLILKDHSKTFCKLLLDEKETETFKEQSSDEICHSFIVNPEN